ncbi:MAG TPA: sterol desaturase family protein [Thermoanaerobaculia bacterium]|nr:sterol desaturase family protein [Thermoanaerobaculia bacterium]
MITALALKVFHALGAARFFMAAAVFIPLERLLPHRTRHAILREGWTADLLSYFVNGAIFLVLLRVWQRAVDTTWLQPLPYTLKGTPIVVQAIAVVALGSFVYYWGHRLLHVSPLLWRFHAVHHSSRRLDWLATYRGHVFETCYFTLLTTVPMVLLEASTPAVLAFFVYRFFEGHIEHSNVRVPLGPLKWVIPSPWFHHWHHATDADAQNKNFSPYPLWDVVFGTAFMPEGRMPAGFGTDEPVPESYAGQLAFPLVAERRRSAIGRVAPES